VPAAVVPEQLESRVQERRLREAPAVRHADALAVRERSLARARRQEVVRDRVEDDARGDLAALLEADENGPERKAADEVHGAVDGVDDPARVLAARGAELLAEKAPLGESPAQHAPDGLLRLAVRLGHGRLVGLDRHLEAAAVVAERDR